jgi:predicted phage terminase large subunit-like protein
VAQQKPKYVFSPFHEKLIEILQRVADGELRRVMIFVPPRHGKSELVSRLFSAYYLYRYPERFVGLCSYAAELAYTLSRASRANFEAMGGGLSGNASAVKHWETTVGGGLWAAGVGGPITGKGFHLGIIDDPLKNAEDAASEKIREKQKDWYASTFYTREETDAAIVVLQTRWHEDDLSGWLLSEEENGEEDERENWHIISLPAIAEEPQKFPNNCTVEPDFRAIGEPLWAEKRGLKKLKLIEKRIGDYFFGALFQQRPKAKEGAFFKVGHFKFVDAEPNGLRQHCRAWDLAASTQGDYTVGVKAAIDRQRNVYILDMVRGRWLTDDRNREMLLTANADGRQCRVRLPQDPGQAGVDQVQALTRMFSGFAVRAERPSGDKETRADSFASQVNAGNVYLLRADWNKQFIEELRAFPLGKNDDQVDAASDAFTEVTRGGVGVYL